MTQSRIQVLPASIQGNEWTKTKLIEHLKIGIQVELSTIPLYLYAYYSINVEANISEKARLAGANARFAILGVVQQEMLHTTWIGNILRAVDDTPMTLYNKNFVPVYPTTVLSSKVPMSLTRAGRQSFENFLLIEAPYIPLPPPTPPAVVSASDIHIRDALPDDPSIGEFYENLAQGIEELSRTGDLFNNPHLDLQFGEQMFNRVIQIKDKETALAALDVITEQGEGGISIPESHYLVFIDLHNREQGWTCYNVPTDPVVTKYPPGAAKELALAFDAAYCYLLVTIERVWAVSDVAHRRHLTNNIHAIMMAVISPLAGLLVQQTITYDGQTMNAAPCFEYYPQTGSPGTIDSLHAAIKEHLNAASTQDPKLKDPITRLLFSVDEVAPYQQGHLVTKLR